MTDVDCNLDECTPTIPLTLETATLIDHISSPLMREGWTPEQAIGFGIAVLRAAMGGEPIFTAGEIADVIQFMNVGRILAKMVARGDVNITLGEDGTTLVYSKSSLDIVRKELEQLTI